MNPALQRTVELLLIILIGYLLQRKLSGKQQLEGVKLIILNVALPATIFLALLKIELEASLLILPIAALGFNLYMLLASRFFLPVLQPGISGKQRRTLSLLLPSLAPGLSCFPFILAYLDDSSLALAALADVGNKFFGLILLYLIAMQWYHSRNSDTNGKSTSGKLKGLFLSLIREPINAAIAVALILLIAGLGLEHLPAAIASTINRFSLMMVGLVLLFIGMAVRVSKSDLRQIVLLLSWRSGMALLFSGICLLLIPTLSPAMALLILVFPQSSCSFWPFAHMHLVGKLEADKNVKGPTFDTDLAINILACSLPFSSLFILLIFNFGSFFSTGWISLSLGSGMVLIGLMPKIWSWLRRQVFTPEAIKDIG